MDAQAVILVVDDDDDVREMIVEYLSGVGFSVVEAETSLRLRQMLSQTPVDLVLLDRTMPDGDALRLVPELRRQRPNLPIIMVTALGQDDERVRGLESGADDYVTKPFIWSELVARMRAVLRRAGPAARPAAETPGPTATARGRMRRLEAAILFADVEGFTRMMQADEAATLRVVRRYTESVVAPLVTASGGRIVKTLGDGFLALLPTATHAVVCARSVQQRIDRRNARLPASKRARFRIGLNLARVVETPDGDVWGHGINLAARLQTLAPPGGIVASESIREAVESDLVRLLVDRGLHRLKNVRDQVRVFELVDPQATCARTRRRRRSLRLADAGSADRPSSRSVRCFRDRSTALPAALPG
jgi:DNA-binding response OmpR family regulator